MNLIEAVIQPYRLGDVRDALVKLGVQGMTILEVKGFGRQKGHKELYRGAEYHTDFIPKVLIKVAVAESLTEQVMRSIRDAAHTGKIGDGKIFISHLTDVMRIRTGEAGSAAL
jgi:nitrogen regulatory protein PII